MYINFKPTHGFNKKKNTEPKQNTPTYQQSKRNNLYVSPSDGEQHIQNIGKMQIATAELFD